MDVDVDPPHLGSCPLPHHALLQRSLPHELLPLLFCARPWLAQHDPAAKRTLAAAPLGGLPLWLGLHRLAPKACPELAPLQAQSPVRKGTSTPPARCGQEHKRLQAASILPDSTCLFQACAQKTAQLPAHCLTVFAGSTCTAGMGACQR